MNNLWLNRLQVLDRFAQAARKVTTVGDRLEAEFDSCLSRSSSNDGWPAGWKRFNCSSKLFNRESQVRGKRLKKWNRHFLLSSRRGYSRICIGILENTSRRNTGNRWTSLNHPKQCHRYFSSAEKRWRRTGQFQCKKKRSSTLISCTFTSVFRLLKPSVLWVHLSSRSSIAMCSRRCP